jgi:hypothetical protein
MKKITRKNDPHKKLTENESPDKQNGGFSEYAEKLIPDGAVMDFIFYEDFDGDGVREAFIGFTEFSPFPPESSILYIKPSEKGYSHKWLLPGSRNHEGCPGIYDNAAAVDTDGDGKPELVVSVAAGNGHYLSLCIFDCEGGLPALAWQSGEAYYHGNAEVADFDGDGRYEVAVEKGTDTGKEILALNEACYHVREGLMFKWNGSAYTVAPAGVKMPYQSYNAAVAFLLGLWRKDYRSCYKMAALPYFLGLEGLDDSSLAAFRKYASKKLRPVLMKNLSKGKLIPAEPFDTCCLFIGADDDITVELSPDNGLVKISGVSIFKRILH